MKILSRGNLPEQEIFKGTCSHCKTVFECSKSEGLFNIGDQRDGPYLTITCPVCKKSTYAYPTGKYNDLTKDTTRWGGLADQYANPASQFDR